VDERLIAQGDVRGIVAMIDFTAKICAEAIGNTSPKAFTAFVRHVSRRARRAAGHVGSWDLLPVSKHHTVIQAIAEIGEHADQLRTVAAKHRPSLRLVKNTG
jgi:hypothetical protein